MFKILKNLIVFSISLIILTSYLASICILLYLNSLFNPYKKLEDAVIYFCKRFIYNLIISIFGYWFRGPIFIKYDKEIVKQKRSIIISNHCSDYDWIFLFMVLNDLGKYNNFKLLLKRELASIPLIGFGLKKLGHIFLNRDKSKDIQIIKKGLKDVNKSTRSKCNVVLYPEGTYMHQKAIDSSLKFANKMNILVDNETFIPKNVLIPRRTGFNLIKNIYKNSLQGVIDITIFINPYVRFPCEEVSIWDFFFSGKAQLNQFIFVKWIPKNNISQNFLFKSFKEKDDFIRVYLKNDCSKTNMNSKTNFLEILDHIDPIKDGESVKTLYMYSPYKPLFFTVPFIIFIFIFKIFK